MEDFELLLFDRIEKIKSINEQYDLEHNAYISFSGGKDSTILHHLIDLALPNNKIPRVFINTGIEYLDIVNFVKDLAKDDDRFVILVPTKPIKKVLEEYGYPFKNKVHSKLLSLYQNGSSSSQWLKNYLSEDKNATKFRCPKILKYQFSNDFNLKITANCCEKLKKQPVSKWEKENNKNIVLTGMRTEEGGQRANIKGCILIDKNGCLKRFHPLIVISKEWEDWFITKQNIQLSKLYYPPFNFQRTGCKGCPFSLDLQKQLDVMEIHLPSEKDQCERIWKPVYDEYRRLNYRLRGKGIIKQTNIYDFIDDAI